MMVVLYKAFIFLGLESEREGLVTKICGIEKLDWCYCVVACGTTWVILGLCFGWAWPTILVWVG